MLLIEGAIPSTVPTELSVETLASDNHLVVTEVFETLRVLQLVLQILDMHFLAEVKSFPTLKLE